MQRTGAEVLAEAPEVEELLHDLTVRIVVSAVVARVSVRSLITLHIVRSEEVLRSRIRQPAIFAILTER